MANITPKQMYIKDSQIVTEYACDERKTRYELYNALVEVLGNNFTPFIYRKRQKVATGKYISKKGEVFYLRVANITFMGGTEGQHPIDLKRIQYDSVWRDFYNDFSSDGVVLWLGLYSYKGTRIWGVFDPKTYLAKHDGKSMISKGGHNAEYSCHIHLHDLFIGHENKSFSKTDKNGNKIEAINFEYLQQRLENGKSENPIISVIKSINDRTIHWNKWIVADEAIPYMKDLKEKNGFSQWRQNLWNGWLVEAIYSDYLYNKPSKYIEYIATSKNKEIKKEYKKYKLDLAFPNTDYHFIGDLKAVCEGDDGKTLLNDEKRLNKALKEYKKIWFIFYIHDKKKGDTNDYEMVKWRNFFLKDTGNWKKNKPFNSLSAPATPHSIAFSRMVVIQFDEITKDKYFEVGKQYGLNSNGSIRGNKYKIDKNFLTAIDDDSLVIYRWPETESI